MSIDTNEVTKANKSGLNPTGLATIVICEDDRATLELLADHLSADKYDVLIAPSAADALRLCKFNGPDLLLLDLSLGGSVSMDVLEEIREADRASNPYSEKLGVIVMSGRGTERDRVRALEFGADDYLVKPYGYSELLARIAAVLRRRSHEDANTEVVGEITIDRTERTVKVGERTVELSSKEYSLLVALAEAPSRVFSKEELLRDIWGYRSLGHTRTLEAHASRLRRKLDPETGRYIVNCWGVGYRLMSP